MWNKEIGTSQVDLVPYEKKCALLIAKLAPLEDLEMDTQLPVDEKCIT